MSPLDKVLSRLHNPKQIGNNKYKACCPAHDDRSPSFQVTEFASGKIGIQCWSGCDKADILGALGLRWSDLDPQGQHTASQARQLFDTDEERLIIGIAQSDIRAGKRLSDKDKERYKLALLRINGRAAA